jgi:hypothetical protein
MQRCRREGVPKGELGILSVITSMQARPNDRVSFPHRNVARLFLALEQVTVIAFDDRVRLFVHICVHPE